MTPPRILSRDPDRLSALRRFGILDTPPEQEFDDLRELAATLCEAPIALISFVDADRQWFKSAGGLGISETSLDTSICAHALLEKEVLVVADTLRDERFRLLAICQGDHPVRFYAGAIIRAPDGQPLGTICVLDYQPRALAPNVVQGLVQLARQVGRLLELRWQKAEAERVAALRGEISLRLAGSEPIEIALQACTESLVQRLGGSFARIWTLEQEEVLHLRASAGLYTHLDGPHARVRVGEYKIGRIAQSGRALLTNDVLHDPNISDPDWARAEGMRAFAGYPLAVEGRVLGVLAMFSRQVLSETVLHELAPISDSVAQYIERKRADKALEDAARGKDEFLAMLAHELRNPLAPLRHAVTLLHADEESATSRRETAAVVERQVRQMMRLVDDLLDASRITRGHIELRREHFALSEAIESAAEISRPLIGQAGQVFTMKMPAHPILLHADRTRMAQIFSNLLNNASKYTGRGGAIWLTATLEDGAAIVQVKDSGVGIARENLDRVFDLFVQEDRSLERSQGGLGIGLTLVRKLVEMHGGKVSALSEGLGLGSTFSVRLPVERLAPAGMIPPPVVEVPAAALRILVVDDNQDAASTLAKLLRRRGHEVALAHDGREAVTTAASFQPDAALLDIGLPRLNGYEAARQILAEAGTRKITLIALTGWGQDEDRRRALEAGFTDHLVKPIDFEVLVTLLGRCRQA